MMADCRWGLTWAEHQSICAELLVGGLRGWLARAARKQESESGKFERAHLLSLDCISGPDFRGALQAAQQCQFDTDSTR